MDTLLVSRCGWSLLRTSRCPALGANEAPQFHAQMGHGSVLKACGWGRRRHPAALGLARQMLYGAPPHAGQSLPHLFLPPRAWPAPFRALCAGSHTPCPPLPWTLQTPGAQAAVPPEVTSQHSLELSGSHRNGRKKEVVEDLC